jgi:methylmalonyl-CoA/ethylmalonyl-CoA epimerase
MFKKIAHIGIAVKNLDEAVKTYSSMLDETDIHRESVREQKVDVAFFHVGETHIELSEATSSDSPIAKFIEKRGEGVHHIAFEVDDIRAELLRLKKVGVQLVDEEPRVGAGGCLVAFIHPKSTNGVLMELTQKAR